MGDQYHLKFDGSKAQAVDAYLEYKRMVGDDDGGQLMNPDEYEAYKKKMIPQRMKNRIYTSWSNAEGMDCKMIGPETLCFCQHRYHQHKTDFARIPEDRPILLPCGVKSCRCVSYHFVPMMGSQPIRCSSCKHMANEHSTQPPHQCSKSICQKCAGFKSSYTDGCGLSYNDHMMIVETREEREARGHPVGQDVGYKAMGGLTGFSSLAEGYMRLDPSGQGAPSQEFLDQEITSSDHTFLRAAVPSIQAKHKALKDYGKLDEDLAERMSAMKKPGEDDMDYFERRYQERLKREAAEKRGIQMAPESRPRTGNRKPASGKPGSGKPAAGRGRGAPKK